MEVICLTISEEERRTKDIKREEKIIKAQKRRIDQKSLVMSEFSTGFVGIANQDKEARKAKVENNKTVIFAFFSEKK